MSKEEASRGGGGQGDEVICGGKSGGYVWVKRWRIQVRVDLVMRYVVGRIM